LAVLAVTVAAAAFTSSHVSAQSQPLPGDSSAPDEAALSAAGAGAGWWDQVRARIEASEYEASMSDQGLQAPNRAQDLRTRFGPAAITIVPRREAGGSWQWSWQTVAWGREADCRTASEPRLSCDGNRVTYTRPGLVEWYENRPEGLEQGFEVLERPAGEGALVVAGSLRGRCPGAELAGPRIEPDGQSLALADGQGSPVLRVVELAARDAAGASLPAWMEVEGGLARIRVDDRGARYPITIDPLWLNPSGRGWILDSPQAGCEYASAVATAGDVNGDGFDDVLVGAPYYDAGLLDEGRAFLHLGSPSGPSATADWSAEGNQVNARLGWSVATAGDVNGDGYDDILVGAPLYDHGQVDEGAAFAWLGSATGLGANGTPANADWTTESSQVRAYCGVALATAGDVNGDGYDDVIVSASYYDRGETDEGEVYVFHGYSGGLHTSAAWYVDGDDASGFFGTSVATAGDVNADGYDDVIIGASHHTVHWVLEGVAYAWYGSATGLSPSSGPADADWSCAGGQGEAYFGRSVSTVGDVQGNGYAAVIVGAPGFDNGEQDEGRAAVFSGGGTGLAPVPTWTFESDQVGANLGWSVATAGDWNSDGLADFLVGVPYYDPLYAPVDAGAVFLYTGNHEGPSQEHITVPGEAAGSGCGRAVGTAGDVNGDGFSEFIVGAPYYDGQGRARIYDGAGCDPHALSAGSWVKESNHAGDELGYAIAAAGDVNGDGYGDIIVGAPMHGFLEEGEGAIYVFPGTRDGPSVAQICHGYGGQVDAHLGRAVAGAGDLNGDGYDDVVIGAPDYDAGQTDEGLAVVLYGSASGPTSFLDASAADWTAESDQGAACLGSMVAGAGDVNGDGYADLLVGAPAYDNGSTNEGVVLLWEGGEGGLGEPGDASNADWAAQSNLASALLGAAGGTAGDVNGDGYSDIVVGAYNASLGEANEGCVYAWHGGPEGMGAWGTPGNADWAIESNHAGARFGFAVSTAGDVNGDGYSDVVVGAYSYDDGAESGGVYFYEGSATGLETVASWEEHYPGANSAYGYSVAPAGDVDGDGYGDFMVGAKLGERSGYTDEGLAYVYNGAPWGPMSISWVGAGGQTNCFYGAAVAGAGDVNGDGFDDVMVGAPRHDNGQTDEGRVYLYLGNDFHQGGDGRERRPRQARSDGSALIALRGASDAETSFLLRIQGRTTAGRGKVRLQWEVKPLGVPFDGTGLGEGAIDQDTGVPAMMDGSFVELNEPVTGLQPGTVYGWRMRVLTDSPFFARSRWFWMSGNGLTQWSLRTAGTTSAFDEPGVATLADRLRLGPAFPNPFRASTSLSLESIGAARTQVTVYDPAGRRVAGLWDGRFGAGCRTVVWDGRDDAGQPLPDGIYFIRAQADGETMSRSVMRVR